MSIRIGNARALGLPPGACCGIGVFGPLVGWTSTANVSLRASIEEAVVFVPHSADDANQTRTKERSGLSEGSEGA